MELEREALRSPVQEVPVVEGEVVLAIRASPIASVGSKAIARAVGVAQNTVRQYLRQSIKEKGQIRPAAQRLTDVRRREARALYDGPVGGNAVVVQRLLVEPGVTISVRTIERAVSDLRRARRVAQLATMRLETAPSDQLQIDSARSGW
jgi:transposase